ncbi:MAG TPA: glycosyltransferase family 2 protein [Candidatus Saccharimonadales bacterium]|nr:glycosyltransferase family 2 protein [Candidatus Saccharimonadales bacterium]
MKNHVVVIIPNWNGAKRLGRAIESVLAQSHSNFSLIVVDNGSADGSRAVIERYANKDSRVRAIYREKNYGFTGGVNPGFEVALAEGADYAAPFNNDASADKDWLKHLVAFLESHPRYGIAACTLLHEDGKTIDSTADLYTIWGIPYPRGRDEPASDRYNQDTDIFGASGGASMYRVRMLREIGLLDQDFFAYYEDIDLSFRAQLAGWRVGFVPAAVVYHEQGATSQGMGTHSKQPKGANTFTTKQYMRNLPFILVKDMPASLLVRVLPRFIFAYTLFFVKSFPEGRGGGALAGATQFWLHLPKKLLERQRIQKTRIVSPAYIWSIFTHDLPPNAYKLRRMRAVWWRVTGRGRRAAS